MSFDAILAIKGSGNFLTNGILSLKTQSEAALTGFGVKTEISALANFGSASTKITNRTAKSLRSCNKRFGGSKSLEWQASVNTIISSATTQMNAAFTLSNTSAINAMTGFTANISSSIVKNTNMMMSSQISMLNGSFLSAGVSIGSYLPDVSKIVASANSLVGSVTAGLSASLSSLTSGITAKLTASLNLSLTGLKSLIPPFPKLPALPSFASLPKLPKLPGFQIPKFNFFVRAKIEASTSKYIQAKIPSISGSIIANAKILATTPDMKIITPQLKVDINVVKRLENIKSSITASIKASIAGLIPKIPIPTLPSLPALPTLPSLPALPALPALPGIPNLSAGIVANIAGSTGSTLTSIVAGVNIPSIPSIPTSIPASIEASLSTKIKAQF